MSFEPSRRVKSIGSYAFAEVDNIVAELRNRGIEPFDFGVGDPTTPAPEKVISALREASVKR